MHGRLSIGDYQIPWAILPETLETLARFARGDILAEEIQARLTAAAPAAPDAPAGVAVIPVRGVITPRPTLLSMLFGGGGGLEGLRADLRAAVADDQVGSILLDIDSPGGSTALLTETAADIRAASRRKPVVAIANTTAASAAYWLGAQADEFVASPSAAVGSIGVYAVHQDLTKAAEQEGVTATVISAGKHKTDGHPLVPLSDDARDTFQQTVDDYYGMFIADVAKGRGVTVPQVRDGFGEGRVVTAKRAAELGMVDRVDTYERTLARMVSQPPERRSRTAAELERPDPAALTQDPQPDNPEPNPAPAGEEATARIAALVTARPHHIP